MKVWPKVSIHAALVLGSLIFSFPFFWMILTSIKQQNEMTPTRMQLLPRVPTPVEKSPYVDGNILREVVPEEVKPGAWDQVLPELRAYLRMKIESWLAAESVRAPYSQISGASREQLVEALVKGSGQAFSERLSNRLREESFRLSGDADGTRMSAWKAAVLEEAEQSLDGTLLAKLSRECLRNFEIGKVRIQLREGTSETVNPQGHWQMAESSKAGNSLELSQGSTAMAYSLESGDSLELIAEREDLVLKENSFRSLFLGLKGDESWARVRIQVEAGGRTFVSLQNLYLWNSDWREEELKFPTSSRENVDSRGYLNFADQGKPTPFKGVRVRVEITKLNSLEAWTAKILLNYQRAAGEVPLVRYFATSISLVLLNVLLMIFACTLTGYAFARLEWPGREVFFGILLATMMIPAQVTMIPNFLVIRELGWFNTLLPLWVPAFFGAPYFIFLVRQFLKNIPKDLEEAARLDGCGFLRIYWHVMLPLVKPTVASIAIFTFIASWNNFLGPLIYLNDDRLYPLALGLFRLNLSNGSEMGLLMAASFIMTLPVILIFFFLQRFFIQGLALSGTKE